MRWRRSSQTQVEDRRGDAAGGMFGGGSRGGLGSGGMGIPLPIGGGLGGIIIVVIFLLLSGAFSGGSTGGLGGLGGEAPGGGAFQSLDPADEQAQFLNAVTVDIQTFWEKSFQAAGKQYPTTVLVLFSQATQTGCGVASSATGPFYCPADQKVYLDTGFFDELASQRFGAPGDFAQAYVIAHEFGHHVQNALGIMDQVASEQQSNPDRANDLSIRLELQADCLAGTWAHSVWAQPDQSDVESITQEDVSEAIKATEAVGDDRIQDQATGTINKESWTHGSSEQRTKWFQTGFQQGTTEGCDTFAVAQP
ncbi:MAG TPA: neutral zinc metallopeptidase [Candidatus Eisenbacteria bacterium]|nr:neutral zinc metallopeptidase [Candidatus Eisenbacteria bacterium]